jgi:KDO2-lipid IV(A) lauroyltransferase
MGATFAALYEPTFAVVKELDFPPLERLVAKLRESTGNRCISKENSMRTILGLLKENRVVGILLDQNLDWRDGVFVKFFGHRACTNKGMALLHKKSRAAVIPVFIYHQGQGRHVVRFMPEVPFLKTGDKRKDVEENTQAYTRVIESMVREVPDHWFWVHKRWKTRPECPWPR